MKPVFHIITGLNEGGAEAVLYRLVMADVRQTYHVISMMDEGKYGSRLRDAGVPVTCLNMPQGKLTLGGLIRLWKLLRHERPEVVQTWMYHADLIGGVVARLAGVKKVFWGIRHTTLERGKSSRITIWIAYICARLSRFVPYRIVCCAQMAVQVHAELGYRKDKLVMIANGYDLSQFTPDATQGLELREQWRVPEETPLLGMVGRFDPQKDHENLIKALGLLKAGGRRFRCVLVGRGLDTSNTQLTRWIERHDLEDEVLLLGQRNDISTVMNALDLHVLSSSAEGFPNVLAEAMACGTPCATTDVGDAGLIVGKTGWVVPPRDPGALENALCAALDAKVDMAAWEERCKQARNRIMHNFSLETMMEAYHQVWLS